MTNWNRYNELNAQACEAQASVYATLKEAASLNPLAKPEEREKSVEHYYRLMNDYMEMARKYRSEIRP